MDKKTTFIIIFHNRPCNVMRRVKESPARGSLIKKINEIRNSYEHPFGKRKKLLAFTEETIRRSEAGSLTNNERCDILMTFSEVRVSKESNIFRYIADDLITSAKNISKQQYINSSWSLVRSQHSDHQLCLKTLSVLSSDLSGITPIDLRKLVFINKSVDQFHSESLSAKLSSELPNIFQDTTSQRLSLPEVEELLVCMSAVSTTSVKQYEIISPMVSQLLTKNQFRDPVNVSSFIKIYTLVKNRIPKLATNLLSSAMNNLPEGVSGIRVGLLFAPLCEDTQRELLVQYLTTCSNVGLTDDVLAAAVLKEVIKSDKTITLPSVQEFITASISKCIENSKTSVSSFAVTVLWCSIITQRHDVIKQLLTSIDVRQCTPTEISSVLTTASIVGIPDPDSQLLLERLSAQFIARAQLLPYPLGTFAVRSGMDPEKQSFSLFLNCLLLSTTIENPSTLLDSHFVVEILRRFDSFVECHVGNDMNKCILLLSVILSRSDVEPFEKSICVLIDRIRDMENYNIDVKVSILWCCSRILLDFCESNSLRRTKVLVIMSNLISNMSSGNINNITPIGACIAAWSVLMVSDEVGFPALLVNNLVKEVVSNVELLPVEPLIHLTWRLKESGVVTPNVFQTRIRSAIYESSATEIDWMFLIMSGKQWPVPPVITHWTGGMGET